MTDSLSQYCPNCEAQAKTSEALQELVQNALRDYDDCGRQLSAAYADVAIATALEALRDRMAELTAAISKEWGAGSQQHCIGRDFMDLIDAFETAKNGELEPNSKPISTHSTTYIAQAALQETGQ